MKTAELFDTHVHLDLLPENERSRDLESARQLGITSFVVPGVSSRSWQDLLTIAEQEEGVYLAPGLHPLAGAEWSDHTAQRLQELTQHHCVIAIGEIGLDRHGTLPLALQEEIFRQQLRIAISADLPIILHCRGHLYRTLQIFKEEGACTVGGILHAFSGSLEMAIFALKMNLLLGFGGAVTWESARRAPLALQALPETAWVLESDAPDQSPEPYRHRPNHPQWLELIARHCAELRDSTIREITQLTTNNARRIFRLPAHSETIDSIRH